MPNLDFGVGPAMLNLLAVVLLSLPPSAGGIPSPDTVYVLPDVTVSATRLERSAFEATARIDVIEVAAAREAGADNVADALEMASGAFLRRYGPAGLVSISLRGTGASQSAILIDGRRISDPQLGQLDLSLLPSLFASEIEVMNGASSPFHGADGIGGAIGIRSLAPRRGLHAGASVGAGAFGSRDAAISISGGDGPIQAIISAEVGRAENEYPYYSQALQRERRLDGADRAQQSLYGSIRYKRRRGDLRISLLSLDADRGLGGTSILRRGDRQTDRSHRVWADARFGSSHDYLKVGGLLQHGRMRYTSEQQGVDDLSESTVATIDVELAKPLPGTWTGMAGGEVSLAGATHPSLTDAARELRSAAFLLAAGEVGRTLVETALRADVYHDAAGDEGMRYGAISPRLGISHALGERVRMRGSIARGFRAPTFNDRYWVRGGNEDLRPERGWNADAGITYRSDHTSATASLFGVDTRNQIVWLPATGSDWAPENLAHTRSMGLELGAKHRRSIGSALLHADLRYTLTRARNRSDSGSPTYGMPLRYVPRDVLHLNLALARGRFGAGAQLHYTGRRYMNEDATDWLDPFVRVAAQLRYRHPLAQGALSVSIHIDNLLDADYAVVAGYPMPPRHARLSITFETGSNP